MLRFSPLVALLTALPALAQDPPQDWVDAAKAKEVASAEEKAPDGWAFKLTLGANGSYTNNASVVGLDDGNYLQIGAFLDGEAAWRSGQHLWRNTLAVKHQQSKNPTIDPFVKSADELQFISLYRYALESVPWLGPFARFRLTTALFPSEVVRAEDTPIRRLDARGNEEAGAQPIDAADPDGPTQHEVLEAQDTRDLTAAFEPLILRQTAGIFAAPWESKAFRFEASLGAGAQEVLTQEGYIVADDDTTPALELRQLQSYNELGVELDAAATGEVNSYLTWGLSFNMLHPFVTTADTDKEGLELTNIELGAKLSARLNSWASLDYVLSAKRIPLIVDDWQVQNTLLVTAAFSIL